MAFRLIHNRAQQVAVIAFVINVALSLVLLFFGIAIYLTMPFLMVWIMIWVIGSSIDDKADGDEAK